MILEIQGRRVEVPDGLTQEQIFDVVDTVAAQLQTPEQPSPEEDGLDRRKLQAQIGLTELGKVLPGPVGAVARGAEPLARGVGAVARGVGAVAKEAEEAKFDITGAVTGGLGGARLGVPLGRAGIITGGVIGAIVGGALGKTVDQQLGEEEQKRTFAQNIKTSALEEAGGRAVAFGLPIVGRVAKVIPGVKQAVEAAEEFVLMPIFEGAKKISRKLGLMGQQIPLEESFLTSKSIDPANLTPRSIIDAQENVLGKRMLLVSEEADVGAALQAKLQKQILDSQKIIASDSAFIRNRAEVNKRLISAIGPKTDIRKTQELLTNSIKTGFRGGLKSFNTKFDKIKKELVPLRPKVRVLTKNESLNVFDDIEATRPSLENTLSPKQVDKLFSIVKKKFVKAKKPPVPSKLILPADLAPPPFVPGVEGRLVTLKDLRDLDNAITEALPKFSPAQNTQNKISGAYAANIKPILRNIKETAFRNNPEDKKLARALDLESQFASLAEERGGILNSKIGRALGLTEQLQLRKGVKPQAITNKVFESQQTWEETKNILNLVNPDLIPILEDNFRAQILKEAFDPVSKEITFSSLQKVLEKRGQGLIADAAGPDYLNTLKDSLLITNALNKTEFLKIGKLQLPIEDKLKQSLGKKVFLPIAGNLSLMQGVMVNVKKFIGLGAANDKVLFDMMQGQSGQRLIQKMMNSPLNDPQAYNLYLQFIREGTKLGVEFIPVSEEDFFANIGAMISDIVDSPPEEGE